MYVYVYILVILNIYIYIYMYAYIWPPEHKQGIPSGPIDAHGSKTNDLR